MVQTPALTSTIPPYTIVRQTTAELLRIPGIDLPVHVDLPAAQTMAAQLDVAAVRAFGSSLALDANSTGSTCRFDSVHTEAAFIVFLHALDFGSGWRSELHAHHGKGAFVTIKAGVEQLYREAPNKELSSTWLRSLTKNDVSHAFLNIDYGNNSEEVEPLKASLDKLVDALHTVIADLGAGCAEFGSVQAFLTSALDGIAAKKKNDTDNNDLSSPAGDLVWALVRQFPTTFDDQYTLAFFEQPSNNMHSAATMKQQHHTVCFYKKAQLVVGELYHRFRLDPAAIASTPDQHHSLFDFCDGRELTAYVDNVICATLRYNGVIVPSREVTDQIEHGQELPSGSLEEIVLRAAALCGIEAVVAATENTLSSSELGNYLWGGLGKEPKVRQYTRHATKTVFY